MTRQPDTTELPISTPAKRPAFGLVGAALAALGILAGQAQPSMAQAVEGVVVDLSVLGDNGEGATASGGPGTSGKLKLPPRADVQSRLYVQPKRFVAQPPMDKTDMAKAEDQAESKPAPKLKAPVRTAAKPSAPPQPAPRAQPKPPVRTAAAPPPPKPPSKTAENMESKAPPPPPPASSAAPPPPASPATGETAAAPAAIAIKAGRALQITFDEAETKLSAAAAAQLNTFAGAIRDNKDFRVQLMAYAAAQDLSASKARRISLSRALEVRSLLIDKGVRSTQIDVRALGNKTGEPPANRVDVNLAPR